MSKPIRHYNLFIYDCRMLSKVNKYLFFILMTAFGITFFTKDNYRNVDEIVPPVLKKPVQKKPANMDGINFINNDYEYELVPLYDYEIAGLVVHRMDYSWFSIYKGDSVFPLDLCMIWGSNAENKIYQSRSLSFSQDMRFCFYRWWGNVKFNQQEVSNNHLLINSEEIEKKIRNISTGDQVKIKGQLVNVRAKNLGTPGTYDPEFFEWNTSVSRTDTGGGACEVILVNEVYMLEKANTVSHHIYKNSFYGLIILICTNIVWFFVKLTRSNFF